MPEGTIFPNSQRRSRRMTLPQLILQRKPQQEQADFPAELPSSLRTIAGTTNMGYPWLVLLLIIHSTAPLHSKSWRVIVRATNMGYPRLVLLLPLRNNVLPLSKRTLITVKQMVNVGYPWLAILLMTNMLTLVTPSETVLLARRILFHTVTRLIICCLLIRVQMLKLQHRNPFKLSTSCRIQTMMAMESIADLRLFVNQRRQRLLRQKQQAIPQRVTIPSPR